MQNPMVMWDSLFQCEFDQGSELTGDQKKNAWIPIEAGSLKTMEKCIQFHLAFWLPVTWNSGGCVFLFGSGLVNANASASVDDIPKPPTLRTCVLQRYIDVLRAGAAKNIIDLCIRTLDTTYNSNNHSLMMMMMMIMTMMMMVMVMMMMMIMTMMMMMMMVMVMVMVMMMMVMVMMTMMVMMMMMMTTRMMMMMMMMIVDSRLLMCMFSEFDLQNMTDNVVLEKQVVNHNLP